MPSLSVIVLAAGNSTRLKTSTAKVMHPICGRPMLDFVLDAAEALKPKKIAVVAGFGKDEVAEHLKARKTKGVRHLMVHQKERLGTAHAVKVGLKALGSPKGRILILSGDVPLIQAATLKAFGQRVPETALGLVTALLPDPFGYGRILRDERGEVQGIVEEKDASDSQRQINEINGGIYLVPASFLSKAIGKIGRNARTKEYYLTDLIALAVAEGLEIQAMALPDPHEILGANTRGELAFLNQYTQGLILAQHLERGVGMQDPDGIHVDAGVKIGSDTFLYSGVQLWGETKVGAACVIEPGCVLKDVTLGAGVTVKAYSYLESCQVQAQATVGPFARVRPESVVGAGAKVGNFVELKKTRLGAGAKANHLSYLGDAKIGKAANIGAGTITCNYDGWNKFETHIGEGAFIGSDSQLVAPVKVGKGAYVASGTTVIKGVPAGALAVARVPQRNVSDWANKKRRNKKPRRK